MPGSLHVHLHRCEPGAFATLAAGMLARAEREPSGPSRLLIAELTGDAISLGRFQRRASALDRTRLAASAQVIRRVGGGRSAQLGAGQLAVALAVPDMGALFSTPCAPEKVINRCVRGLLLGLTRAGVPSGAHYFGRDFVSAQGKQLALVSQENAPRAAIFEAYVALSRTLALPPGLSGYPAHGDPRALGPEPVTLQELRGQPVDVDAVIEAIIAGHAEAFGAVIERAAELPCDALAFTPAVDEDERGFLESGVADIPIGFLEALVRLDAQRVAEVRLRGDFIAPAFVLADLEQRLVGRALAFEELGPQVDAGFHQPGACLLGLRELRLFADAVLAAAAT